MNPLGWCEGESQRRGGARESVRGARGGLRGGAEEKTRGVAVARRRRQASWWRGARARRALSLLCLLVEVGDDWHQARWAGPAQERPRWAWWVPGKCPGESLSLSYILFFYFSVSFWIY